MSTCPDVEPHLFAYQLGACEPQVRDDVDSHLLVCTACLSRFLSHKRVIEDGAGFEARPSAQVHHRLRASVLAKKAPPPRRLAPVWVMGLAALFLGLVGIGVGLVMAAADAAKPVSTELPVDVTGLVDAPTIHTATNVL